MKSSKLVELPGVGSPKPGRLTVYRTGKGTATWSTEPQRYRVEIQMTQDGRPRVETITAYRNGQSDPGRVLSVSELGEGVQEYLLDRFVAAHKALTT